MNGFNYGEMSSSIAVNVEHRLQKLEVDLYNDYDLYGDACIRQIRETLQSDVLKSMCEQDQR